MTEKYYVDDELVSEEEFWEKVEENTNDECEYNFDDYLDECEEEVQIFGTSFKASQILYDMDYTMYKCMLGDYQSSQLDDYKYELERYGHTTINSTDFRIEEVEEDEEEISED